MCVDKCTTGYFADIPNRQCTTVCPSLQYGDPSTNKCVDKCPSIGSINLYADNSTMTCVK